MDRQRPPGKIKPSSLLKNMRQYVEKIENKSLNLLIEKTVSSHFDQHRIKSAAWIRELRTLDDMSIR